jgi:hypothetical protein
MTIKRGRAMTIKRGRAMTIKRGRARTVQRQALSLKEQAPLNETAHLSPKAV